MSVARNKGGAYTQKKTHKEQKKVFKKDSEQLSIVMQIFFFSAQ